MAHYAKVEDGIVTQVIVADSQEWCQANLGGTWIQTSYNTQGGVNSREGGTALHKNYAGIGYEWDGVGFNAPQPYPSWTKDADTYLWNAPVAYPEDGNPYTWNEETTSWELIPTE
jgi:hypothetical protein